MAADYIEKYQTGFENKDDEYEIRLYSLSRAINHKLTRKWCMTFYNEIPDEGYIAKTFGGGDYIMLGRNSKLEKINCSVSINDYWNTQNPTEPHNNNAQMDGINLGINIAERMLSLANGNQQNIPAVSAREEKLHDTYNRQIQKLGTALTEEKINNSSKEVQSPIQTSWIKDLISELKPYIPLILNAKEGGPVEKKVKKAIIEDDKMQAAINDVESLNIAYTLGCEDPEIGKEKMDKLFTKMGFDVPAEREAEK